MKRKLTLLLSVTIAVGLLLSGCTTVNSSAGSTAPTESMRIFVDSVGRSVEVPVLIKSAAPSGPLAQLVLYTAAPDRLAGLAGNFSDAAKQYIDEKYWSLPKFGQFYGKNASLNMEALEAAAPDVIIDIGETKKTEKDDMDNLQKQLGIPTVFIAATLDTMESAYMMLGDLLGETDRTTKLAEYCKKTIGNADSIAQSIAENERISVYMAMGSDGLDTNAAGSIHADVLSRVGAVNVANVEAASTGGGSKVSLEQILNWNPDVILVDGQVLYNTITSDSTWQEVQAVKVGSVYCIPNTPYSFLNNPPSVNRIIGINWLGNLLYPKKYQLNIKNEVKEFYRLFYSIDLTDEQVDSVMK